MHFKILSIHKRQPDGPFEGLYIMRFSRHRGEWLADLRHGITGSTQFMSLDDFEQRAIEPVVWLQRSLIIDLLSHAATQREPTFRFLKPDEKVRVIRDLLKSDASERYLLAGIIVGFFTKMEAGYFVSHRNQAITRVVRMVLRLLKEDRAML